MENNPGDEKLYFEYVDLYGFHFEIPGEITSSMLTKNHVAFLRPEIHSDEWCGEILAIHFPDYVSPHGRLYEMLSYVSTVIDAPGMPGSIHAFQCAQHGKKDHE